jgi:hypothetical protein
VGNLREENSRQTEQAVQRHRSGSECGVLEKQKEVMQLSQQSQRRGKCWVTYSWEDFGSCHPVLFTVASGWAGEDTVGWMGQVCAMFSRVRWGTFATTEKNCLPGAPPLGPGS